jgi:hypothetical protein
MATFFNIVRDHCGDAPGNQIEGTGHGDYEHCVKVEITHSRNLPTPRPSGKCFWLSSSPRPPSPLHGEGGGQTSKLPSPLSGEGLGVWGTTSRLRPRLLLAYE